MKGTVLALLVVLVLNEVFSFAQEETKNERNSPGRRHRQWAQKFGEGHPGRGNHKHQKQDMMEMPGNGQGRRNRRQRGRNGGGEKAGNNEDQYFIAEDALMVGEK